MGNAPHKLFQGAEVADMRLSIDTPHYNPVLKRKEDMTPWERVEYLFRTDDFGDISPELSRCKETTLLGFFGGGVFGGVGRGRLAYAEFFRSNAHTAFETPMQARRQLQDKVMLGFGSGCWRVGWRTGLFTFMFTFSSTCIAAYRGKTAVLDQMGGGCTAGFLYKLREGPKSMVAGTIVGGALGLTVGILSYAMSRLTGLNIDEYIEAEYHAKLEKKVASLEKRRLMGNTDEWGKISAEELNALLKQEEEEAEAAKNSSQVGSNTSHPESTRS